MKDKKLRAKNIFSGKVILVCGGTGSIGSEIVKNLLELNPKQIRILARDETKHLEFLSELNFPRNIRSFIGDIRDKERLRLAMRDVDIVFNAAALKHISFCEFNPMEAVKTNVYGTQNIIDAALEENVERVITISTDKAAEPTSTLGATKLLSERLSVAANYLVGKKKTKFAAVRFGNVLGSRNSLLPIISRQYFKGFPITITDPKMTRFVMSTREAAKLVFEATRITKGGEVFILKTPAVFIGDLIETFIEGLQEGRPKQRVKYKIIGARASEKYHEKLLTTYELENAYENEKLFILLSQIDKPNELYIKKSYAGFKKMKLNSDYSSEIARKLTRKEISSLLSREGLI